MELISVIHGGGRFLNSKNVTEEFITRKIRGKHQEIGVFDLYSMEKRFSIQLPNESLVQWHLDMQNLILWNSSKIYRHALKEGVINIDFDGVYTLSDDWIILKPSFLNEDEAVFKVFKYNFPHELLLIRSGRWSRFYFSSNALLVYTKNKVGQTLLNVYNLAKEVDSDSFQELVASIDMTSLFPESFAKGHRLLEVVADDSGFYIYFSNGYLVKFSQSNGNVIWFQRIGSIRVLQILEGKLRVTLPWEIMVLDSVTGRIDFTKKLYSNDLRKSFGDSKIVRAHWVNNSHGIHGLLNDSHTQLLFTDFRFYEQFKVISLEELNNRFGIGFTRFSDFFIHDRMVYLADFKGNICVIHIGLPTQPVV